MGHFPVSRTRYIPTTMTEEKKPLPSVGDHVMVTRDIHFPLAPRGASAGAYINPIGDTALNLQGWAIGTIKRVSTYTEIPRDKDIPVAYVTFTLLPAFEVEICIQCSDLFVISRKADNPDDSDNSDNSDG